MQAARGAAVTADETAGAGTDGAGPGPAARRRSSLLVLVAVLVLAADVLSKLLAVAKLSDRPRVTLIPHVLWLTMTRNAGAAFSVGTGSTVVFTLVAVAVVVVILLVYRLRAWLMALFAGRPMPPARTDSRKVTDVTYEIVDRSDER